MTKLPLTVLVGAGGSVELEVPSTQRLTAAVNDALRRSPASVSDECVSTIDDVVDGLLRRMRDHFGADYSFEHVLHALEALETAGIALRGGRPSIRRAVEPMLWSQPHSDVIGALDAWFPRSAARALLGAVHDLVAASSQSAPTAEGWKDYVRFWEQLDSSFKLSIATLNYDNLIEQALGLGPGDQGFEPIPGERSWRFSERRLAASPRLMHLHGSIHFGEREFGADQNRFIFEDGWEEVYWYPRPKDARTSQHIKSSRPSQARRQSIKGALITGLDKSDKLLLEPYGPYLRALADSIRRCSRLLVIGYGFGDLHVNAALRRLGRLHGLSRRVAVIAKCDPVEMKGRWGFVRPEEVGLLQVWANESGFPNPVDLSNPISAKTGALNYYYDGLLDTSLRHVAGLVEFLSS